MSEDIEPRKGKGQQPRFVITGRSTTAAEDINFDRQRLFEKQQKVIRQWRPISEIWALRSGGEILGVVTMGTSFLFTQYFRTAFKLGQMAYYGTMLPTILVCGFSASTMHTMMVQPMLLLQEETCPVCAQVRAMSVHSIPGVIQPLLLSFVLTSWKARVFGTIHMPAVMPFNPWLKFMKTRCKNFSGLVTVALAVNMGVAIGVTTIAGKQTSTVWDGMSRQKQEEKLSREKEKENLWN